MINPNQRVQFPFGDAFIPNTSYTDRAAQQLYLEQKQREAKQEQNNAALDNEFAKNLSGIRDIDIPELTKAYGDWKLANQQAMKQKNGVPPEQQLELLRKKADMYKVIGGSKQQKQLEDETAAGVLKSPDLFEDTAHDTLIKSRNTPLSKLGNLAGYDYRYKGTNTDFQKILATAAGTPKDVYSESKPIDEKGIQTEYTPYQFGNTPLQYYQGVLGALAQHKAGRDAAAIAAQLQPEVVKQVQDKFLQIPQEKWTRMGVNTPQDLTITPDDTPAQIYAKHEAQLYALNNEPKQGKVYTITNKDKADEAARKFQQEQQGRQFANQRLLEGMREAHGEKLLGMREAAKAGGEETNNLWVTRTVDDIIDEGKPSGKVLGVFPAKEKDYVPPPVIYDALGKPDKMAITKDGGVKVVYYKKDKDGNILTEEKGDNKGNAIVDESRSKTLNKDEFKLALGYKATTKKQLTGEMNSGAKESHPPVKQNGVTYTWNSKTRQYE